MWKRFWMQNSSAWKHLSQSFSLQNSNYYFQHIYREIWKRCKMFCNFKWSFDVLYPLYFISRCSADSLRGRWENLNKFLSSTEKAFLLLFRRWKVQKLIWSVWRHVSNWIEAVVRSLFYCSSGTGRIIMQSVLIDLIPKRIRETLRCSWKILSSRFSY